MLVRVQFFNQCLVDVCRFGSNVPLLRAMMPGLIPHFVEGDSDKQIPQLCRIVNGVLTVGRTPKERVLPASLPELVLQDR